MFLLIILNNDLKQFNFQEQVLAKLVKLKVELKMLKVLQKVQMLVKKKVKKHIHGTSNSGLNNDNKNTVLRLI